MNTKGIVTVVTEQPVPTERSPADSIGHADALMSASFHGADFAEGVTGFTERRPPAFAPLPHKEI